MRQLAALALLALASGIAGAEGMQRIGGLEIDVTEVTMAATTLDIVVSCPSNDASCLGSPTPDPDFVLTQASTRIYAESGSANVERLDNYNAAAGDYVLEVYEYSHVDLTETSPRGRTCLTVDIR